MARSSEVHARGDGAVVVRRGTGAADVEYLRDTAARLAAAAHPGVVEVLRSEGADDWWELELAHAGRPLEAVGRLPIDEVAEVTASLAAIVADLHAVGVVHGAIDASHVLISGHGPPVLCGFGPAGAAATAADDVAAIGELIVSLVGNDTELEPIPDRRWSRPASWHNGDGWGRRALLLVADQACAEPPTRRPSAARLAAAIAEAVPVPEPARDPRLASLAAASLAVIVLAVMALALVAPARGGSPTAQMPTTTTPTTQMPTTQMPTTPTTVVVPAAPLEVATVVEGGRRYEVGEPGDVVVLGDWDGDGARTAAALRPSTGEVFVFSTWSTGEDVVVRAATVVPGGADLVVLPDDHRDRLVVVRIDGTEVPVPEGLT